MCVLCLNDNLTTLKLVIRPFSEDGGLVRLDNWPALFKIVAQT